MLGRNVRTTQPQGPAVVRADIPPPSLVWLPANPLAPVRGAEVGFPTLTAANIEPTQKGVSLRFTSSSGQVVHTQSAHRLLSADGFSALIVMSRSGSGVVSCAFAAGIFGQGNIRVQAHLPFSDGTIYFDFGGNAGPNRLTVSGLAFSAVRDVFVLTAGAAGMRIFLNGRLLASSSSPVTRQNATGVLFGTGMDGGSSGTPLPLPDTNASYAAQVFWPSQLPDALGLNFSINPWQVFAPDSKALWTPGASSVTLPTLVQPSSTTTPGAWTATGAGSLHAAINEAIPSGAEYISVNSASTCEFVLADSAYPGTSNQTLAYRASSTAGSTLTVTLTQGVTTIMTRTHSLTATDTLYTQTLSAGEISLITAGAISVTLTTS